MNELFIGHFDQTQRFRIELERLTPRVDGGDACEEFFVEVNGVRMRRELRRQHGFRFLKRRVRVGLAHASKCGEGANEQASALLHGNEGVRKRRRRRVVGDAPYFSQLVCHAGFDGGLIVVILDFVERRCLERQRTRRIKRIRRRETGAVPARGGAGSGVGTRGQ
jgi:hypothetical protein